MNNKKGSSIVMLAMIFVSLMISIVAAISISRALVVKSECESFGMVWEKAILSEYDTHLLEDYSIMAYQGSERDITKKLNTFIAYSCVGKLDASIDNPYVNLCGYELSNPDNFGKSIKNSLGTNAVELLINGSTRTLREKRGEEIEDTRIINNSVVLDTLPSRGIDNTIDIESLAKQLKEGKQIVSIQNNVKDMPLSIAFMYKYLCNNVTYTDSLPHLFTNEWEYVLVGSNSDYKNYRECRNRLFILRNCLNLASLYADSTKTEIIVSIAEMISPGPGAAVTQALLAEMWAAAETESDLKTLYDGGRIPIIKKPSDWKTDLGGIVTSDEFTSKLDDQSKALLNEKKEEINGKIKATGNEIIENVSDGQNYDEYLMIMLAAMNGRVRMLRSMDIVQINMKYRYYSDFNMSEYFVGTGFTLKANGRSYEVNDKYK